MRQPRNQTKGKSKDKAPKAPPPAPQKPPNPKLMLRVPPLSSAIAQAIPPTVSPRTPELTPEAGPPQLDEGVDSDICMPEVPYVPSPRQQIIDQFWEDNVTNAHESAQKEDLGSELLPNEATSHPQNHKDPGLPGAGVKRKASTHSSEHNSSVNPDSDSDSDSDLSIQLAVSKKARRTPKEPIEVEETDEELDKVVTKGRQGRKPSKKERMRHGNSDDEDDSYKNST